VCSVGSKNKKIGRNEQKIESYKPAKERLLAAKHKQKIVFIKN